MALQKSSNKDGKVLDLNDLRKQRTKKRSCEPETKATQAVASVPNKPNPGRRKGDKPAVKGSEETTSAEFETPLKRSRVSNRRFDKVKVERIKAEIANGEYQINYLQVADKFIEHERYT